MRRQMVTTIYNNLSISVCPTHDKVLWASHVYSGRKIKNCATSSEGVCEEG